MTLHVGNLKKFSSENAGSFPTVCEVGLSLILLHFVRKSKQKSSHNLLATFDYLTECRLIFAYPTTVGLLQTIKTSKDQNGETDNNLIPPQFEN